MFRPSVACQPRPQYILDLAVGSLHQTIALWVVGCGRDVVDLEVLTQPLPQGGGELVQSGPASSQRVDLSTIVKM